MRMGRHIAPIFGMPPETLCRIRNKRMFEVYPVMIQKLDGYSSDELLETMKSGVNTGKRKSR